MNKGEIYEKRLGIKDYYYIINVLCKNIICCSTHVINICNNMIQLLKTVQLAILNIFKRLRKIKVR